LELGIWLFIAQVEDDSLSKAMSRCLLNRSPTDLELGNKSQPFGQMSGPSQQSSKGMNPLYSWVLLSAMWVSRKTTNTLAVHVG
jgi:hypothetical protein